MVRLRRVAGRLPLLRVYELELMPPDAERPWRTTRPISALAAKRRLYSERFYQRDVADLLLEADELWKAGRREEWVEHAAVRPIAR